jgi:L-fuconolactonase
MAQYRRRPGSGKLASMRIDAHQHFWRPARGDYGWLAAAPAALQRDFLPVDFTPIAAACGIDGTVLVQAAPTSEETRFMLGLAEAHPIIRGVVGWCDLAVPDGLAALAHPLLLGIRPMLQDIAETGYILRPELAAGLEAVIGSGLAFDALIQPRHLGVIDTLLRRHPRLRLVVDHAAKPRIGGDGFDAWAEGMAALAAHPGAHCKLSGLVTEAASGWSTEVLAPFVSHLRRCFGAERLIWGSDWPVATIAASYEAWLRAAQALIPAAEHPAVFGGNAARFYGLG